MSNPFDSPISADGSPAMSEAEFHDGLVENIREYRIWHIGLGGIYLLMVGLMVLFALFMIITPLAAGGPEAGFMSILGFVYLVVAAIYSIPAILLMRSGLAARRVYSAVDDRSAILESMRMQLWLWRILGVLTFAVMGMYALMLFAAILLGGVGAML